MRFYNAEEGDAWKEYFHMCLKAELMHGDAMGAVRMAGLAADAAVMGVRLRLGILDPVTCTTGTPLSPTSDDPIRSPDEKWTSPDSVED